MFTVDPVFVYRQHVLQLYVVQGTPTGFCSRGTVFSFGGGMGASLTLVERHLGCWVRAGAARPRCVPFRSLSPTKHESNSGSHGCMYGRYGDFSNSLWGFTRCVEYSVNESNPLLLIRVVSRGEGHLGAARHHSGLPVEEKKKKKKSSALHVRNRSRSQRAKLVRKRSACALLCSPRHRPVEARQSRVVCDEPMFRPRGLLRPRWPLLPDE